MGYQDILYDVEDRVATVTLNRPDRMNAWTPTMEREVREAISGNICRCTGYQGIVDAALDAAKTMQGR